MGQQYALKENRMYQAARLSNVVKNKGIRNVKKQKKG
jgi:hypothetical protein